mmetsp:Transcript_24958/g.36871  ORF Transcript_24958/g.36871 Transcript_24958/m.36871 type:complete len:137 (+) Transcript_24958:1705-2115(+)
MNCHLLTPVRFYSRADSAETYDNGIVKRMHLIIGNSLRALLRKIFVKPSENSQFIFKPYTQFITTSQSQTTPMWLQVKFLYTTSIWKSMSIKSNDDNFMSSRMLLQQLRNAKPTTKVGARVLNKVYIVFKKRPFTV